PAQHGIQGGRAGSRDGLPRREVTAKLIVRACATKNAAASSSIDGRVDSPSTEIASAKKMRWRPCTFFPARRRTNAARYFSDFLWAAQNGRACRWKTRTAAYSPWQGQV